MRARPCARLQDPRQGRRLYRLCWLAVFSLWLGMAVTALAASLLCAGRWARFCAAEQEETA